MGVVVDPRLKNCRSNVFAGPLRAPRPAPGHQSYYLRASANRIGVLPRRTTYLGPRPASLVGFQTVVPGCSIWAPTGDRLDPLEFQSPIVRPIEELFYCAAPIITVPRKRNESNEKRFEPLGVTYGRASRPPSLPCWLVSTLLHSTLSLDTSKTFGCDLLGFLYLM